MSFSSAQLIENFPELQHGNAIQQAEASHIAACENYTSDSLVFCNTASFVKDFYEKAPAIIITTDKICESLSDISCCILISPNLSLSHALIKQALNDYDSSDAEWPRIHSSSIIHESAQIKDTCRIGPNVVIGANANIGNSTIIRAGSIIEHDVIIGDNCIINSLCNIGYDTCIGNRVIIHSNASIGNEGFGFAQDQENRSHRIPQTGNVIINDDVQIGSNCNIDRATYGSTIIGRGTKIDSLCQISHNVIIGEDCIITSQCGIAGSSVVGNRVIMSGQTGVIDHITIVDDAILVHRCGVTTDITEKGMWAGTPPKKFKDYVKDQKLSKKIDKLQSQLNELKKQLKKD